VRGIRGWVGAIINVFLILTGLFFLIGGTYVSLFDLCFQSYCFWKCANPFPLQASVESVVISYSNSAFGKPFTCASNAL
jgi:hypothetical protein